MTTSPCDGATPNGPLPRSDEEMLRIARRSLIAQGPRMDTETATDLLPDMRRLVAFTTELIASPEGFVITNGSPTDVCFRDGMITVAGSIGIDRTRDGDLLSSSTADFGQMHFTPGSRNRTIGPAGTIRFWCTMADENETRSPMGVRAVPGRSSGNPNAIDASALLLDARIAVIALERIVAASACDATSGDDPYVLDWKSVEAVTSIVEHDVIGDHPIGQRDTIGFASPWRTAMIGTDWIDDPKDPRMARSWMLREQVPLIRIDMLEDAVTISSLTRVRVEASTDPVARMRMHAESEAMRIGPIGRRYATGNGGAS
jgi:hypothetical protein